MDTNDHPRRYRVTRREPGIDWSGWTHTYHSTLELARHAAETFVLGRTDRYRFYSDRDRTRRYAFIAERREVGRRHVRHDIIEKVSISEATGEVVVAPESNAAYSVNAR